MEGKGRGVFSTNLSRKVISSVSTLENRTHLLSGSSKKRGAVLCKSLGWMFHVLLHVQDEEAMVGISAMYYLHASNLFRYFLFLFSVDATCDDGKLGRLVNHSSWSPNVKTTIVEVDDNPHLVLTAAKDNYGKRRTTL